MEAKELFTLLKFIKLWKFDAQMHLNVGSTDNFFFSPSPQITFNI